MLRASHLLSIVAAQGGNTYALRSVVVSWWREPRRKGALARAHKSTHSHASLHSFLACLLIASPVMHGYVCMADAVSVGMAVCVRKPVACTA